MLSAPSIITARQLIAACSCFSATFLAACICLFIVPWWFPSSAVAAGESYALGFNNRIAVIGLVCVTALSTLAIVLKFQWATDSRRALRWFHEPSEPIPARHKRNQLWILTVGAIGLAWAILLWDSLLLIPYWGEADYFHTRMDLIALGYRPYVDFQHNYGPLMLTVPVWLDWASQGSLGFETAYAWMVAAWTAIGIGFQYLFLQRLRIPHRSRPLVMGVTLLPWIPLHMGLNGTPLRFTLLPCVFLGFDWAIRQASGSSPTARLRLLACVIGGCVAGFLISPEIGLAATAGAFAVGWILLLRGNYFDAVSCGIGGVVSCLLVGWIFPGYFHGLLGFAGGNANFPIYPNIHNLLLAFIAPVLISWLLAGATCNPGDRNAPLAAAIATASTVLLAPSLGRCDPGHIVYNSFTLFLVMLPAAAAHGRFLYKTSLGVFTFACGGLIVISYLTYYIPVFQQAFVVQKFYDQNPNVVMEWRDSWDKHRRSCSKAQLLNWKRTAPFPSWVADQAGSATSVSAPFGGDIGIDRFTKLLPGFRAPFHPCAKPEIHVPHDAERAAADARSCEFAILPYAFAAAAEKGDTFEPEAYEANISTFMSRLMLFPITAKVAHRPFFPELALSEMLIRASTPAAATSDLVLLRMRPPGPLPNKDPTSSGP